MGATIDEEVCLVAKRAENYGTTPHASLFEGVVEAVKERCIVLTTLAQLGNTVAQQRHMFELNKVCAADIPERGEFHTWDQYVERRIEPG